MIHQAPILGAKKESRRWTYPTDIWIWPWIWPGRDSVKPWIDFWRSIKLSGDQLGFGYHLGMCQKNWKDVSQKWMVPDPKAMTHADPWVAKFQETSWLESSWSTNMGLLQCKIGCFHHISVSSLRLTTAVFLQPSNGKISDMDDIPGSSPCPKVGRYQLPVLTNCVRDIWKLIGIEVWPIHIHRLSYVQGNTSRQLGGPIENIETWWNMYTDMNSLLVCSNRCRAQCSTTGNWGTKQQRRSEASRWIMTAPYNVCWDLCVKNVWYKMGPLDHYELIHNLA